MSTVEETAQTPTFSVIIPSYRSKGKLTKTLRSVLSQDYASLECLVLDGGSDDGTLTEMEAFASDARLRLWSAPDEGIYDAMNKGISQAKGQVLYFLGAGDLLRPGVLGNVEPLFRRDRVPHFVYGDVFWVSRGKRYDGRFSHYKLLRLNICHQAIFYHRSLFSRLGLFDQRFPVCADYEFNLRCFGDRSIRKEYVDLTIADYEGDGVSAESDPDPRFTSAFGQVIRSNLGRMSYQLHLHYETIERYRKLVSSLWSKS